MTAPDMILIPDKEHGGYTVLGPDGVTSLYRGDLVPAQRRPVVLYQQPEPFERVTYLKEEIIESLTDGRAIICTGIGVCVGLGGIVAYQITLSLISAVNLAIAVISAAIPLIIIALIAAWLCRSKPQEITLRGCPNSGGPTSYNFTVDPTGALRLKE